MVCVVLCALYFRLPFDELLATADVVSMHASLSPSTRYAIVQLLMHYATATAALDLDLP